MTPMEWIANGEVGTSSKTIWCAMQGISFGGADVPHDPDDFSRCAKLLLLIPGWRNKINLISSAYPWWEPYISAWGELEQMWHKVAGSGSDWARECSEAMYNRMQQLYTRSCEIRYPDAKITKREDGTISSIHSGTFMSVSLTAADVAKWPKPKKAQRRAK